MKKALQKWLEVDKGIDKIKKEIIRDSKKEIENIHHKMVLDMSKFLFEANKEREETRRETKEDFKDFKARTKMEMTDLQNLVANLMRK